MKPLNSIILQNSSLRSTLLSSKSSTANSLTRYRTETDSTCTLRLKYSMTTCRSRSRTYKATAFMLQAKAAAKHTLKVFSCRALQATKSCFACQTQERQLRKSKYKTQISIMTRFQGQAKEDLDPTPSRTQTLATRTTPSSKQAAQTEFQETLCADSEEIRTRVRLLFR